MGLRKFCLSCNKVSTLQIINLGMHSFADRFISVDDISNPDPAYLLSCFLCQNCGFVQTSVETSPVERYQETEYSYTSSNSKYALEHWKMYAESVFSYLEKRPKSILEIGSNDGTLLKLFKETDPEIIIEGIDASPKMVDLANQNGVKTYLDIFGEKGASIDYLGGKKYDVVIANNVLNHSDNPSEFLLSAFNLLKDNNSIIIYELPYWKELVDNGKFDQIYHEHVSYFTIENSINLVSSIGLEIFHVELNSYHGGSIRIFCSKKGSRCVDSTVGSLLDKEHNSDLRNPITYLNLHKRIIRSKIHIIQKVNEANSSGRGVVCIGAAAKANTLLTFYGLNCTNVNFITDSSPYKIGKFTPLTRIPIKDDSAISDLRKPLCILTSWNISSRLIDVIKSHNPLAEVISPHLPN